ncbi:MAG: hypothetical protein U0X91_00670 [Spirosomataceae bacterium]
MKIKPIYFILPLAICSMFTGVYAGWLRLGWDFPILNAQATALHGALMTGSFLGTLIAVERVAVLKNKWMWLVPLAFVSSLPLLLHVSPKAGCYALVAGSIGYSLVSVYNYKKYRFTGDLLLLIGSIFQFLGHLALALTYSYPMAFAGWMAFFVFTIVGERLNLTRFLPVKKNDRRALFGWLGLFTVGLFLYHTSYSIALSVSIVGIGQWLIRNDIARQNLNKKGSYQFLGITLLSGYSWLLLTGLITLVNSYSPWLYDAVLHAFFVGFVLTMIMAHAPIIFPSLLGLNAKPYHPILYGWVGLLQVSILLRIVGDLFQAFPLRQWGGLLNGLAFIGYLVTIAFLIGTHKSKVVAKRAADSTTNHSYEQSH